MSKRKPDFLVDDEVTEQQPPTKQTMNDFLGEVFQDSIIPNTDPLGKQIPSPLELQTQFTTKSARIRYLYVEYGMEVKAISAYLHIRYQMVRNILTNELKRGPNEPFTLGDKGGLVPLLQPKRKP